jgi:methylglutamate dehydrogenase subunit C
MTGPVRIARGHLTDPSQPLKFRFDGRQYPAVAGDTLASALLANGRLLTGRSFKYHRPRGIVTAGPEEPCALVDVIGARGREPNHLATTLLLHDGLVAESQNRWPSLRLDVLAVNDLLGRFLPAGFYYKTFMAPGWAWERFYEPLIRRAAGLGRLQPIVPPHADLAETVHQHADVLVVGAGACGLAAAHCLGSCGLRVIVAEHEVALGGGTLLDERWDGWREAKCRALAALPAVRRLPGTTVLGAYGQGVFGALETLTPAASEQCGGLRERLHVMRVRRVLLASGAQERLIAFPGNDVPGVMLAGAALRYLRGYGVAVGRKPVLFVNNDESYAALNALASAGVRCAGVVEARPQSLAAERARELGVEVYCGAAVEGVVGRVAVRGVRIIDSDGRRRELAADCLLMSGGHTPQTTLASQLGAELTWQDQIAAFTPALAAESGQVAGAARGVFGPAAAASDGEAAAGVIAAQLGRPAGAPSATSTATPYPADPEVTPLTAVWEVRAGCGKAFVDLQNDVTAADVRLACREGYEHVEQMKRFTTHAMATDQGRIGGLVGSAVLAAARGVPVAAVGQVKPRPYAQPVPFAALAGGEVREHYRPTRRLPLHAWHAAAGATFVPTGLWLRPLVYARQSTWEAVLREARAVRTGVGITDVSTLGKIDVQGADAARFLDFMYANTFSSLAVGRARYGIMLREDGMLLDDGTTARLAPGHFVMTTTTANAVAVLEHLEFYRQTACASLDVVLTDVGDQWAQFAVAGPRARTVVSEVVSGVDPSNEALPFMAARAAHIAGLAGRLFRISFSGELAYELAVPAQHALTAWSALLEAGAPWGITPYGLDALNTLRIEKGHITGAELNGNTSAHDLGFERLLKADGDFVGRALSRRATLADPDRLQLVGVRPVERAQRLRNGMQLVAPGARATSLGYVTSSTPSTELDGWVGLALLAGGRQRIGERLLGAAPIHGESVALEVVSPHLLDPENLRVRA